MITKIAPFPAAYIDSRTGTFGFHAVIEQRSHSPHYRVDRRMPREVRA